MVSLYVFFDFENKAFLHINYPIMEDQLPDQEIIILENPCRWMHAAGLPDLLN